MRKLPAIAFLVTMNILPVVSRAQTTSNGQLSARELYYKPVKKTSTSASRPARAAIPAVPATAGRAKDSGRGQQTVERGPGTRVTLVSDTVLAMRYRLLKRSGARFEEVDADTKFVTGDYIKIAISTNTPAYLYIAQIGTSGKWNILFPDQVPDANKIVTEYTDVELPPGNFGFQFDATPGVEQVFIAASRQPVSDLEKAIASRKSQPAPQPGPANSNGGLQLASITVDDSVIAGLRLQARDLVVQKVDMASVGSQEHAVYVATAPDSNSDLVIADLKLNHQR